MTLTEKIKWLNKGITLGKWRAEVENCQNLTDGKRGQGVEKRIYAGTEDFVNFFETVISTLGIEANYDIEICDGEYEIVMKEVR